MKIQEALVSILLEKLTKYLQYKYDEIKTHLDNCSSITEIVDLPNQENDSWAQIELNPLYELSESEETEIVCDFLITDGKFTFSCCICYPKKHSAYTEKRIFSANALGSPVEVTSNF